MIKEENETQLDLFELDYSLDEVDVTYEFSDISINCGPEITLEEFDKFVCASIMDNNTYVPSDYTRDWVLWEETKPLVGTAFGQVDALKKEVADLTESLYKAYGRIKELSDEVADLKSQLSQFNIHKNTRKF